MKSKTSSVILIMIVMSGVACQNESGYELPINIGMNSDQVSKLLGEPKEHYNVPDKEQQVVRWYYSYGIVGIFDRDRLSRITLNTYSDYQGFIVYSGTVVNHVLLKDNKQAILTKLGRPAKIESDEVESGTDKATTVL